MKHLPKLHPDAVFNPHLLNIFVNQLLMLPKTTQEQVLGKFCNDLRRHYLSSSFYRLETTKKDYLGRTVIELVSQQDMAKKLTEALGLIENQKTKDLVIKKLSSGYLAHLFSTPKSQTQPTLFNKIKQVVFNCLQARASIK